jgi:tyrosyl-tRNA synthetase
VSRNDVAREVERQLEVMAEGAEQLVGVDELRPRLEAALREGRPLRVKLGMDPSAPDLHLGHTLVLHKLKRFQDLGHLPIFLVGDFTARIGDPSGKKKTRPALDAETVRANAKTYVDQVGKVLDVSRAELRFNSEWMDPMGAADVVRLCQRATLAQLLAREDFSQRYRAEEPIGVHELLYPLVQAYDSVALHADVELGGTDQTFNLLMGREIQRQYDQPPQAIVTHPLLVGTDGREKMSKSLGNGIGISEAPEEIYGKVMRVSDELMLRWFDQLGFGEWSDRVAARDAVAGGAGDPLALKHDMARRIVARFHGDEAGEAAAAHFRRVVQRKELPEEIPEVRLAGESEGLGLLAMIAQAGMAKSNSEARRLVAQRAVKLDGQAVDDPGISLSRGGPYLLQVGKRRVAHVWID